MNGLLAKSDAPAKGSVRNPEFRQDVRTGLSGIPKSLPPKWLYDARGSGLFEQITTLPEYYLNRTETSLLRQHAQLLIEAIPEGGTLVELGSGASTKTQLLLDAGRHIGTYVPIDISESSLRASADRLTSAYPDLVVSPIAGDFTKPGALIGPSDPSICFFPGSTIGNLEPDIARSLLQTVRSWPGIRGFIVGVDLVKGSQTLIDAYDDPKGVTAAFIGNVLVRANTELGTNFDTSRFAYRATWNDDLHQIDMWLGSVRKQEVLMGEERFGFDEGERIHVSESRKFTENSLTRLASQAGWGVDNFLVDPQQRFAVAVLATGGTP